MFINLLDCLYTEQDYDAFLSRWICDNISRVNIPTERLWVIKTLKFVMIVILLLRKISSILLKQILEGIG